jgi:hypothetical protein
MFYDRESFECLTETYAVGDDTALVRADLIYGALHRILLKFKKRIPDLCVN